MREKKNSFYFNIMNLRCLCHIHVELSREQEEIEKWGKKPGLQIQPWRALDDLRGNISALWTSGDKQPL